MVDAQTRGGFTHSSHQSRFTDVESGMNSRRIRVAATLRHTMLHRGLVALLLPLGLIFLAFVSHG
jgi:hypothetical protein